MSGLHKKRKQLRRLKIRNITLNTVCILLAFSGISWTVNYFWKYVNYEITNDAVVDQYITPVNIRVSGYISEVRFTDGTDCFFLTDDPEAAKDLVFYVPNVKPHTLVPVIEIFLKD